MDIKNLITDDDAVSPVIGVILMVAITVILAAVIGTFVLGLGGSVQQTAPQASFTFDLNDQSGSQDTLTITHDGGDSVTASQVNVTASGDFGIGSSSGSYSTTAGYSGSGPFSSYQLSFVSGFSGDQGAGTTIYVQGTSGSNPNLADDTFRVVWSSQNGENTATLAKFSGPDA